jgi:heptosyltransferase II
MVRRLGLIIRNNRVLAGRSFALGLFCHTNRKLRVLTTMARVAEWRSFTTVGRPHPIPGRRHHDEHVRLLTGCDDGTGVRAHFPEIVRHAPRIPLPSQACVALCPGGAKNPLREDVLRRWPVTRYAEVARGLLARGLGVVLVGGPGDEWVRPAFEGLPVIDAIGKTGVDEALDLFSACRAVVAHDSGPMHIADLAGVPVVALFGPTSPDEKGPLGVRGQIIWGGADLPCRPCYDGIGYAPCAANACLQAITAERVIAAISEIIP